MTFTQFTRTQKGSDKKRTSDIMSRPPLVSREEPLFDPLFDRFRGIRGIDVLWVKEQVYGTPCVPESCPVTRSISEVFGSLELIEEGEVRGPNK